MNKPKLEVRNLKVIFRGNNEILTAVNSISFNVKENEFLCLIGPSGCGKTTILNAIAGFIKQNRGKVLLDNVPVAKPTRKIGIVLQNHALFPWKTLKGNIEIGLKINHFLNKEANAITAHYLKLIGLEKFANYYPQELSMGMQQRAAIARALANNPEIILMDEPFGSLDAQTRMRMQKQLLKIWQLHKKSIVFVTHDIDEALILSDRMLIMSKRPGRIKKEIINKLPRPRSYELTTEPKYMRQKRKIIKLLEC